MKTLHFILCFLAVGIIAYAQPKFEPTNAAPGEFSRMGFLPRGIAMGNALSAVTTGNLSAYYNPALSVFQEDNYAEASYTFLSLDRHLNFINFTRRFEFGARDSAGKPKATAGLSIGLINSGVSNIDGRDNDDNPTGQLKTSENLLFFAFANKFSKKVAIGFGARLYYYKLYEKITSTAVGFDLGIIYSVADNVKVALVLQDLNATYKWDTSSLYSTNGLSTSTLFPTTKKIGVSYFVNSINALFSSELEFNSYGRRLLRLGGESQVIPELAVRAGLDNVVLNNGDELMQPTLGFAFNHHYSDKLSLCFNYAFAVEQYSQTPRHSIGIGFLF